MCDRIRQPSARERALVRRLKKAIEALDHIIETDNKIYMTYDDWAEDVISIACKSRASLSKPLPCP